MCETSSSPWCCKTKIGWNGPLNIVRHPPQCYVAYLWVKEILVVRSEMPFGYLGKRTTTPNRLEDLNPWMRSPWWRSMVGATAENKIARQIKRRENPVQNLLGYMSKGEWKWRMERVRTSLYAWNSTPLWAIDLIGPMSRSDNGKPTQGMSMPTNLEERDPPSVIGTFSTKRSDDLKLIAFQTMRHIKL